MPQDKIIKRVHAIREAYASRFNFNIRALYRDAKEREGKDGRKVVPLQPRRIAIAEDKEPQ